MKYKYRFRINNQGTKVLNASYQYGYDATMIRDDEDNKNPYCFFTSPHLSNLNEPKEIWARGMTLLSIFRGATNLFYYNPLNESDQPLNLELIELFDSETDMNITPFDTHELSQTYPFDGSLMNWDDVMVNNNPVSKSIFYSKTNNDVLTLLLQLGNGLSWINLYSILDSIKTYCGNQVKGFYKTLLRNCNLSESDISDFTGTANNYGLIGASARHGDKGWSAPANPLTLREAQCLILGLCREYLFIVHQIK